MSCKTVAEMGRLAIQCLVFALLPSLAWTQDRFPSRPIRLVVASEAGSAPDAIARALANEPSVILADEPTGNLDSGTGGGVMDMLLSVVAESQKTLIVVTHDTRLAERGDRKLMLQDGLLVE